MSDDLTTRLRMAVESDHPLSSDHREWMADAADLIHAQAARIEALEATLHALGQEARNMRRYPYESATMREAADMAGSAILNAIERSAIRTGEAG